MMGDGYAVNNVLNFGWLTKQIPYNNNKNQDWKIFKGYADENKTVIMMGHHVCELCGWDHSDYGNGENWIRTENEIIRVPRMLWHYIKEHNYCLPSNIIARFSSGQIVVLDDVEICRCKQGDNCNLVRVPKIEFIAKWKESRYKSLIEFSRHTNFTWHQGNCSVIDGFYIVRNPSVMHDIELKFTHDPENFPDEILVSMKFAQQGDAPEPTSP